MGRYVRGDLYVEICMCKHVCGDMYEEICMRSVLGDRYVVFCMH